MTIAPTPVPTVIVPSLPKVWTPTTIATLIGGAAVFIMGVLTSAGVTVPSHVSGEVTTITGVLTSLAGAITVLMGQLSHASVQKAVIKNAPAVAALHFD